STNAGDAFHKAYNPDYRYSGIDPTYSPEMWARLKAEPNEVKRSDIFKKEAFQFIRENPAHAMNIVVGNFLNFWRPWLTPAVTPLFENIIYVLCYLPIFVLFLVGLAQLNWKDPAWLTVVGLIFYKALIHIPFYMIVRFREDIVSLMI